MELHGEWKATPAADDLRRTFSEPDLDDRHWPTLTVPGHWAAHPDLAAATSVLHRHQFSHPIGEHDQRYWLRCDGIAQYSDVWLDGDYLGDSDGYFVPHEFEITEQISARSTHTLAIDATCPSFSSTDNRSSMTGALQDPELGGASGHNPGGIWGAVHIRHTGTFAIRFFRAVCLDASRTNARVALRCVLDAPEATTVTLRTSIAGATHLHSQPVAVGENRVEWIVDVADPELWWPAQLGDQPLHQLRCELVVDEAVHDHRERRIGFRSVRLDDWTLSVNGESVYGMGIAMLPTRARPADATAAELRSDVIAARDAGANLIRLTAHIARPEIYDLCDELGLMIWQDLPLRGQMSRGVRTQAVRQAREAVDLLGHHPSVVVWCAHDEPFRRPEPQAMPNLGAGQRPSWNRAVLDRAVKRVLTRTDGSRPVVAHTATLPHLPKLDGTTSHLWFGWRGGRASDLAHAIARFPNQGRFVSAFGAATVGANHPTMTSGWWPDIDWAQLATDIGTDPVSLQRNVDPRSFPSGTAWAHAMDAHQAEVIKTTIETLRRVKRRPSGGFIAHYLADPTDTGGFGLVDHQRRPKPALEAFRAATAEVIVVAAPLPKVVRHGERHEVDIHVVSEVRISFTARIDARVVAVTPTGEIEQHRSWTGAVGADDVTRISNLNIDISPGASEIRLELTLTGDEHQATNCYRAIVV